MFSAMPLPYKYLALDRERYRRRIHRETSLSTYLIRGSPNIRPKATGRRELTQSLYRGYLRGVLAPS